MLIQQALSQTEEAADGDIVVSSFSSWWSLSTAVRSNHNTQAAEAECLCLPGEGGKGQTEGCLF